MKLSISDSNREIMSSSLGRAATTLIALLFAPAVWAADYESFTVQPGFGSRSATGVSGGPVAASDYNRTCTGYIDDSPDHQIQLKSAMDLTFTVDSNTDTVLLITGPGGVRCDDDSAGNDDAQISGRFAAGTYDVYVGNFQRKTEGIGRYILSISEGGSSRTPTARLSSTPPSPPSTSSGFTGLDIPASTNGDFGDFQLGRGFSPDPQTAGGINGAGAGEQDASRFGAGCIGTIDDSPDHTITVTSPVNLRIRVDSDNDASLVVRGPAGTFCDDDSAGNLDPQITTGRLSTGIYDVYVGAVGEEGGYYLLTVSEVR